MTDEELAEKRALADALRADPERLARVKAEAGAKLREIPPTSKGVVASPRRAERARRVLRSLRARFA